MYLFLTMSEEEGADSLADLVAFSGFLETISEVRDTLIDAHQQLTLKLDEATSGADRLDIYGSRSRIRQSIDDLTAIINRNGR